MGLAAAAALALCLSPSALLAQGIPAPRHEMMGPLPAPFTVKSTTPTVPSFSPVPLKILDQTAKEVVTTATSKLPGAPMSGQNYYNSVVGQSMGAQTIKATADAASWLDKAMKGMGVQSDMDGALKSITKFGTAKVEMITEWVDSIHPHIFMKAEWAQGAMKAFEMYKALRSVQMMMKAWTQHGTLLHIDLLDLVPSIEIPGQGSDPTMRFSLNYSDKVNPGGIYAAAGMTNPFIGPWASPKFSYQGPRKFSDLANIQVQFSPYIQKDKSDPSVNDTTKEIEGLNKNLDRYFFEGVMGTAAANSGLRLSSDGSVQNRPSPMLLQVQAQALSDRRLTQIKTERAQAAQMGTNPSAIAAKYDPEEQFWSSWPTNLQESQSARINRIRGELQTVNAETTKAESGAKLSNEAQRIAGDPKTGVSFIDGIMNTYKTIGAAVQQVYSAITDKEDPNTSGPRVVYKAQVEYALSTFDAYHEAMALRKILYSRVKAELQNQNATPMLQMKKDADRRIADINATDAKVNAFLNKSVRINELLTGMGFKDPEATIQRITQSIQDARSQSN
jgi:hypothetical protein